MIPFCDTFSIILSIALHKSAAARMLSCRTPDVVPKRDEILESTRSLTSVSVWRSRIASKSMSESTESCHCKRKGESVDSVQCGLYVNYCDMPSVPYAHCLFIYSLPLSICLSLYLPSYIHPSLHPTLSLHQSLPPPFPTSLSGFASTSLSLSRSFQPSINHSILSLSFSAKLLSSNTLYLFLHMFLASSLLSSLLILLSYLSTYLPPSFSLPTSLALLLHSTFRHPIATYTPSALTLPPYLIHSIPPSVPPSLPAT